MKTRCHVTTRQSRLMILGVSLHLAAALACGIGTGGPMSTQSPPSMSGPLPEAVPSPTPTSAIPTVAPASSSVSTQQTQPSPLPPLYTGTPLPAPTEIRWDTSPDALTIRYWDPDRSPGPYAVTTLIPPLQVWGDGRVIWLSGGTVTYQRQMMEGYLSTKQMHELLQHIVQAGFFEWESAYTEAAPLPAHTLVVKLADQPAHSVYVASSHPPDGFHDLITFLLAMPATIGGARPYVPARAIVQASQQQFAPDADIPQWPDAGYGLEEISAGTGMDIEGETLDFAWDIVNQAPGAPMLVQSRGKSYYITLAVPGVSLCTGKRDPAFDVRWSCP